MKNKDIKNSRLPPQDSHFDVIFGYFWNHGIGNRFDNVGDPQPWTPETLEAACETAGKPVDRRTIQNWRSGKNKPGRRNMHVLAKVASGGDEKQRQAWADQFIATLGTPASASGAPTPIVTPPPSENPSQSVTENAAPIEQPRKDTNKLGREKLLAGLLGCAATIALGVALLRPTLRPSAAAEPMRVAVMPFENLSDTPANSYISAGVTDDIIQSLAQVPDLYVSPRRDSRSAAGKDRSMKDIGGVLKVDYILDGTMRVDAGRMKLNATLIHIKTGEPIWSGTFDDQTDDLFSIQEDVAVGVTDAFDIIMSPERRAQMFNYGTSNVEAYRQYLKGRHLMKFWHETHEGDDIWRAGESLEAAVAADPAMGRAWVHMADLYHHYLVGHIGAPATGMRVTVPDTPDTALTHLRYVLAQGEEHGDETIALQAKANRIFFSSDWTGLRPAVLDYAKNVTPQRGELEWLYVPIMLSLLGETKAQTRLMDDRVLKYDPGNGTGHAYVIRQYLTQGQLGLAEARLSDAEASTFSSRLAEVRGYMLVSQQNGPELRAHVAASKERLSPLLTDYFTVLAHYFNGEPEKAESRLKASTPLKQERIHLALAHNHMGEAAKAGEILAQIADEPIGAVQIAVELSYGAACGPNPLPPILPLETRMAEGGVARLPCIGMAVPTRESESVEK